MVLVTTRVSLDILHEHHYVSLNLFVRLSGSDATYF
nr:MAG TPA: hypothetical protein [Caudoviricetes sp.]